MAESPKVDNAIRRYLAEIKMAPMLEEFVAETVAERPDDIYAFMENFARRKRAEIASNNQWTLLRSWTEHAGKSEASLQRFADSFFQLLFITQRTMKKTVFAKVADDIPSAGAALAKVFDRAVRGDLSDLDLASLVAKHASDVDIEPYHFQSIITTLLLALRQSMPQEAWEILSEEWRYFCTTNSARVESAVADAKVAAVPESPASPALPTGTSISARDSWEKMPEATQHSVVRTAFETLFTQHAPLKRNFFSDVDLEALYGSLTPLLDKLMKGTLTDEDIKATGIVEAAIEKGAKAYHIQYGVTALLMGVSIALGRAQWSEELATLWRDIIFDLGVRVTKLITPQEPSQEAHEDRAAVAEATANSVTEAQTAAPQSDVQAEEL